MYNRFLYTYDFWPIKLLAAVGIVLWVVHACSAKVGGSISQLMHHRDRVWFALIALFVPAIVLRFLLFHLLRGYMPHGPSIVLPTVNMVFNGIYGAIYGMAACWFAAPTKIGERFNIWTALTVAVVLTILISGFSMLTNTFRLARPELMPIIPGAVVILAFLISRAFIGKHSEPPTDTPTNFGPSETEHNPAPAFLWLLVGLAPIPILLVLVSSQGPHNSWAAAMLIVCALCNLTGGLGCLGGIKNIGVRIILGIFLGIFFFLLSWIIAAFHACSGASI